MDKAENSLDMITNFVNNKPLKTAEGTQLTAQAIHPHIQNGQGVSSEARPLRLVNA
jgi:hypothetical protein